MPTVSAHVAVTLAAHVDHVFGVMGNGNAYFLDALTCQTDARFVPVRHEAGAVVAADAFHRASGRLAAATTTYGAGFTNTLTALAEAVQAHVPLVLVVGDEPTSGPRPWDVDQIAMASAVGARTVHGRPHGRSRHDRHRRRARADLPGPDRARHPLRRRDVGHRPGAGDTGPAVARAARRARGVRRRRRAGDRVGPRRRASAAAPRRARRLGGGSRRGARGHRRRDRRADGDDGARARDLPPRRVRPRRRRRVRRAGGHGPGPRGRRRGGGRAPPSTSSRCGSATSSPPGAGCSRSTSRPRRPTRTSAGTSAGTLRSWRRRSSTSWTARRPAGGASPSTCRTHDGTSPGTGPPRTDGSTRAQRQPGSPSCCPRTASSCRTVGTSSAGRTCTGPCPRRTGW